MREFFRPYNKIITMESTDPSAVLLTDSGGALLACNYVVIRDLSGGGSNRLLQVIPSGINTLYGGTDGGTLVDRDIGPSAYPNASERITATVASPNNSASGVLGIVADAKSGSIILSLGPYDATKALLLSQGDATTTTYMVTYGQVNLANTRADNRFSGEEDTWVSAAASFTSSVDSATSTVVFTNTSQGVAPFTYSWEFSSVQSAGTVGSTEASPTHTYVAGGAAPFRVMFSLSALHGISTASGDVTF
tara:strand:+ start:5030 stop:5776 length:747 start_codon:yes stop_codon:yes gene_type:complete